MKTLTLGVDIQVDSKAFKDLQKELNTITADLSAISKSNPLDKTLANSAEQALKLQSILNGAWDSKLNQLDLSKFNTGLKSAGISAQNIQNILSKYPTAYENFSRTVIEGNVHLKQTNKLLDKMAVTMANTVRFGISSSIFNNLTNSIQKAYDYTLKLDRSLNDIRIVSDASAESMEKFAKYANESAKQLGASTLDYTKGALIYYQQGLSEDEVIKRTDTTIKMSNALGASTEEVSSYMTAIWNNFGKGAQNLEYYGDVITALGASTASSAAEIAGGLEKFAAVGETIGLSYEYATSALATIVATTRQSEDTVGNSLKTIFARIQGLSLGETLEDGTTLNKYSEALAKVGVSIKTESGQLKDMDTILNELGQTWGTLTKAQQTALAQTVAGVRQYNQLMALMNNWGDFQKNLNTAYNSTGTLAHQQDIYLDSLDAHLQQLSTEWEKTYSIIFDEKTIKSFVDIATTALSGLNDVLTGLGGGMSTIINLGLQLSNLFSKNIGNEIFRQMQNSAQATEDALKNVAIQVAGSENTNAYQEEYKIIQKIKDIKSTLNEEEYQELVNNMKKVGQYQEQLDNIEQLRAAMRDDLFSKDFNNDLVKHLRDNQQTSEEWEQALKNVDARIIEIEKDTNEETEELQQLKRLQETINTNIERAKNISHEDEYRTEQNILKGNVELKHKEKLEQIEIQQAVRGTTAAASLLGIAVGRISVLMDDNLTKWEKAKAIMAGLANTALILVRNWDSLKNLKNVFANFIAGMAQAKAQAEIQRNAIKAQKEEVKKLTKANKDNAKTELEDAAAKQENAKASKEVANAASQEKLQKNTNKVSKETENLKDNLKGLTKETKQAGDAVKETAEEEAVMEGESLAASGAVARLGASFHALIPYLIAAAVAIAAVYGAYRLLYWEQIEEAKLLKQMQDDLDSAKEAYKEANEEYQDLLNTISNYQSAQEGIQTLEEGTLQWYQAIQKTNEEAQKLIEQWGLIAGQDYTLGKGGLIQIKQSSLDDKMYEQQQTVYQKQADQQWAQLKLDKYNIDKDQARIVQEFKKSVNSQARKQSSNNIITTDQARTILNNMSKTQTNIGQLSNSFRSELNKEASQNIGNAINTAAMSAADSINQTSHENTIDITTSISKWGAQYRANQQKIENQTLQWAQTKFYGAATREQIKDFEKLSTTGQRAVLSKYAPQFETIEENREENVKQREQNIKTNLYTEVAKGTIPGQKNLFDRVVDLGALAVYEFNIGGAKDKARAATQAVEEKNAQQETIQSIEPGLEKARYVQAKVAETDFSKTSQKYITGAILAAQTGQLKESDLKYLSKNELQYVKDNYVNDPSKFYKNLSTAGKGLDLLVSGADHIDNLFGDNIDVEKIQQAYQPLIDQGLDILAPKRDEDVDKLLNQALANREDDSKTLERIKADTEDYNNTLKTQAEVLGTSSEALQFYGLAAKKAGKVQDESNAETAESIAQQYKFNKMYNNAVETYAKNEDAIKAYSKAWKNNEEVSYDVADAMGEVAKSLKDMGLSLSTETISEHLELINQLLTGTEEDAKAAYTELKALSNVDILASTLNQTKESVNDLGYAIANLSMGDTLADEFAADLIRMVNDAHLTEEELTDLFNRLQLEVPPIEAAPNEISTDSVHVPGYATRHFYKGEMPVPDGKGGLTTQEVNYYWDEWTQDHEASFVKINDNVKTFKSTGGNKGGNFKLSQNNQGNKSKGSGGSGKSSQPKTVELTKDKSDRYHKVNTQIEKTSNNLDKLEKAEEKALGGDWVNNLTLQFQQLNNQIANYNEKLRIAQGEQAELRNELSRMGAQFNADGTIANYNELFDAYLAKINALEREYNNLSAAQQEQWDKEKRIDNAKEQFSQLKENMNRYDELISSFIPDIQKQIQDAIDEIVEKQIEKFNKGIDLRLDISKATRDWDTFKTKVLDGIADDDIIEQTKKKIRDWGTYYNDAGTGAIQALVTHLNQEFEEFNKDISAIYGQDDVKEIEDLEKYYEELMTQMEAVFDLEKEIHEAYIDMMKEAQDEFDKHIKQYKTVSDLIEHDMKLIELVYGKESYSALGKYYDKQIENDKLQLDFQRQQVEFWRAARDAEEEGSDAWIAANDNLQNAQKELNDGIEKSVEHLRDSYVNAIDEILQNLNKDVTGGKGLDYINTEWTLINKEADQYLDTINQLFETQALENKYLDAIDQTDNIAAQKKLKAIMDEEISALKEKDKLTQYDIDRANKRYEIALKQIALEEAQQNKSTMRLRRDSQGNYRYEYVADNDAIDQAKDELDKLKNDLYNFDKNQYNNSLKEMYDTWVEYQGALKDAAQINDPEERAAKEKLIKENYEKIIDNMLEENLVYRNNLEASAIEDLDALYGIDAKNYKDMTDEEKEDIMEGLVPTWDSGIQEMITKMNKNGGFKETNKEAFDQLHKAQDTAKEKFEDMSKAAGISGEEIKEGLDPAIEATKTLITDNDILTEKYVKKLKEMQDLNTELGNMKTAFAEAAKEAEKTATWANQIVQSLRQNEADTYDEAAETATHETTVEDAINGNPEVNTETTAAASPYTGDGIPRLWDDNITLTGAYHTRADGSGGSYDWHIGEGNFVIMDTAPWARYPYQVGRWSSAEGKYIPFGWVDTEAMTGYDTGGYTGEWGNNGRLAMLHQKELVLNASDTENILNAVNAIRTLTNSVGIATLARLANLGAGGSAGTSGNGLEQNVHITATFPNATSSREIEDALLNLTNKASQYIGRR